MHAIELSMEKYILETPAVVRHNIGDGERLTRAMVELYLQKPYRSIWFVACGSSCNAVYCARYYMRKILDVDIKIITPFTFNHYEHDMSPEDFVICISQSGCSTNTIESLRLCRKLGVPAIGLTGNVHSNFESEADVVVDFGLYGEKLDFVTKGVSTLTVFLMLFSAHAAHQQGKLTAMELQTEKEQMILCMENYDVITAQFGAYFARNKMRLLSMEKAYLIGAGANYGTALEGAVKIGETVHILAVGYEVEEFIHGPQIQLTPNYNFIFIDPGDETSERIRQAYYAACRVSDRVFILTNNPQIEGAGVMRVPHTISEVLSPLYALAFVQLIAYHVAQTNFTWRQHPLMKDFKEVLFGKSDAYEAYDCT